MGLLKKKKSLEPLSYTSCISVGHWEETGLPMDTQTFPAHAEINPISVQTQDLSSKVP